MFLTSTLIPIDNIRIFRIAFSITSSLIYLQKSLSTLVALITIRPKARLACWMTTNANVIYLIIIESHRFAISNAHTS